MVGVNEVTAVLYDQHSTWMCIVLYNILKLQGNWLAIISKLTAVPLDTVHKQQVHFLNQNCCTFRTTCQYCNERVGRGPDKTETTSHVTCTLFTKTVYSA